MSFYEGRRKSASYADVHEPLGNARRTPSAPVDDTTDWSSQRKARPAEHLLPVGVRWIAALPPGERPAALAEQYPRIANLLALQWADAGTCAAYFNELLTDRRGNRRGFPEPVHQDLLRLREHWYGARRP